MFLSALRVPWEIRTPSLDSAVRSLRRLAIAPAIVLVIDPNARRFFYIMTRPTGRRGSRADAFLLTAHSGPRRSGSPRTQGWTAPGLDGARGDGRRVGATAYTGFSSLRASRVYLWQGRTARSISSRRQRQRAPPPCCVAAIGIDADGPRFARWHSRSRLPPRDVGLLIVEHASRQVPNIGTSSRRTHSPGAYARLFWIGAIASAASRQSHDLVASTAAFSVPLLAIPRLSRSSAASRGNTSGLRQAVGSKLIQLLV